MNKDIIVVLGIGIKKDGSLPNTAKTLVKKSVELFNKGVSSRILMSGAWSFWLDTKPSKTESSAMKEYAMELGVSESSLFIEEKSKDTIGNIYFSKVNLLEPNDWKNIIILCSSYRRERISYLSDKILGHDYRFSFDDEPSGLQRDNIDDLIKREKASLNVAKKWLETLDDGDTESIKDFLYIYHPGYADDPIISKNQLREMIDEELKSL